MWKCFIAGLCCALPLMAGAQKSTVRVDARSGRLVRTVEVPVREVKARIVSAQEASTVQPGKPIKSAQREQELSAMLSAAAKRHGVEEALVRSVAEVESNLNPRAVSPKGALGVMQLMPATARSMGVADAFNAADNIEGGVRYLKHLQQFYSDERLVLAAYNAGPGAVKRYGWIPPYQETVNYVVRAGRKLGQHRRANHKTAVHNAVAANPPMEVEKPMPTVRVFHDAWGRMIVKQED
jgi:soluble lytic murein transglycosylase-like protein